MEISAPIPKSDAAVQEPIQAKSVKVKSKNDKLGMFAKILEGLVHNPKQASKPGANGVGEGLLALQPNRAKGAAKSGAEESYKKDLLSKGNDKNANSHAEAHARLLKSRDQRGDDEAIHGALLLDGGKNAKLVSSRSELKEKSESDSLKQSADKANKIKAGEAELAEKRLAQAESDLKADGKNDFSLKNEKALAEDAKSKAAERERSEKNEVSRKLASSVAQQVEVKDASFSKEAQNLLNAKNAEQEGKKGAHEVRGRDSKRRETRANIEVHDFRTSETALQTEQAKVELKGSSEIKTVDMSLDLTQGNKAKDAVLRSAEQRPAQAFEDFLARELHQNLNGDIVRQAQIILKDQGAGMIRLALRPESLGNVKIHLEMSENKIVGHIVVESNEALKAFEREIKSLEQAFKDSGFDGAQLDMSLAGGNDGTDHSQKGEDVFPFISERFAAESYDALSDTDDTMFNTGTEGEGMSLINVLV